MPEALFINCCDTNPLSVDPFEIINFDKVYFDEGISLLKTLFDCDIHITYQNDKFDKSLKGINYHQFVGPHPAGLVGTHISKIHPVNINSNVWTLGFQDIISMGYLKINKKIRTHKIISIGGPAVFEPSLLKVRYGSNIEDSKQKLMYDLYYIKNWSIWLEFEIGIRTFMVIFSKGGL